MVGVVGEQKTKPTQQVTRNLTLNDFDPFFFNAFYRKFKSVRELRSLGLTPDIVVCRSAQQLDNSSREKIALFCHVESSNVISCFDVSNVYRVPIILNHQNLSSIVLKRLNVDLPSSLPTFPLEKWTNLCELVDSLSQKTEKMHIAVVGKYTGLSDAYLSLTWSLKHASHYLKEPLEIDWIEASSLEPAFKENSPEEYERLWKLLKSAHGILVPGGFGGRGIPGKLSAIQYARENRVPFLGICLGLLFLD